MLLPYANLQMKHWNPGATMPLILPIHVICNTSDEDLHANIKVNSRRPGAWLKSSPAHDGVAVFCGSGPSLVDTLDDVRGMVAAGATLFAMNGAARFLADNGVMPDYQVIIDPRPVTADLVGPARHHMFASQVHPSCFERAPDAQVWHLQIEGIDDLLPTYDTGFVLIGGAASVGNTATCMAYAMGFRTFHIYGYDSCHRNGNGHAFKQSMNDGDPCAVVAFNGKEYLASLTMKLQAEKFQITGRALRDAGCKINVHGSGLLPDMWNTPMETLPERDKYRRMWEINNYRRLAPGEHMVPLCMETLKPVGSIIDFGCGTGRAGLAFSKAGLDVITVDFASNCRDHEAMGLRFFEFDLSEPMPLRAPYGYCTDVMEHIPPHQVEAVIQNITASSPSVFFQISTVPDTLGALINQDLHLTVMPAVWWKEQFIRLGFRAEIIQETPVDACFLVHKEVA